MIIVIVLATFVPLKTPAQEKVTLGLGVSFNPSNVAGDNKFLFQSPGAADFYLFVKTGEYFRAEFQFGLLIRSQDQTYSDSLGEFIGHISAAIVRFGFGAFYTWHPDSTFTLYAGPRTGVLSSSEYLSYSRPAKGYTDQKTIWAAFFISGCFGAEGAITQHVTLGGELQFTSTGFGVPNQIPPSTVYPRDFKQNVFSTNALIFARFYF
ncbi:MAG: hypothetical protein ACHQQQ_11365 [Bacteroidota bacterium]